MHMGVEFGSCSVVVAVAFTVVCAFSGLLFFGDFLLIGDPFFHKNTDGTAVALKVLLRPASEVRKSAGLKCLEHTLVCSVNLKCWPISRRIAIIHFLDRPLSSGNLWYEILTPSST